MSKLQKFSSESRSLAQHFERPALFLAVLSGFTFIVYSVSLSFQFVWDDIFQIVDNPLIRSWGNVPRIFATDLWAYVHRGQLYYRPLFATWSVFNYSLFKLNAWGWHLTAVLLHLVAVLVVYDLARKLRLSYWTCVLATIIFSLHPIHIESIAWVSAASDTLVTIFYVLAFSAFLRSRETGRPGKRAWGFASIFFLACALLTKEMAITFLVVVAVYVWMFPKNGESTNKMARAKEAFLAALPYAIVTILYLLLRKYELSAVVAPLSEYPSVEKIIFTLPYVLAFYLRQLLVPAGLTGLYYTPYLTAANFAVFAGSLLVLLAWAMLVRYLQRRTGDKTTFFLALWPLLTLAPALYLPNFRNGDFVRDRYAYLPSVGFALLVAQGFVLLPSLGRIRASALRMAAAALLVIAFLVGATQQIYWETERTVFERGAQLYPHNLYAQVGLARLLMRQGELDRSIQLLQTTMTEDPKWTQAYYLLAEAYSRAGRQAEGRKALEAALLLTKNPTEGDLETADLAGLYGRLGEYDQALELCKKVLSESPDLLSGLYNCGIIDFQIGHDSDAEALLQRGVAVAPGEPSVIYWLGRVHLREGKDFQAQQDFTLAVRTKADAPDYHFWLGESLRAQGKLSEAQHEYNETLRLNPAYLEAKNKLEAIGPINNGSDSSVR